MWIPKSEEDLTAAAASGALTEGPTFEAKREIGNKSKEIAKDICAMTIDGGVIVYGLAEDEHKRPAVLTPFPLKGAAERLNMIARTCISEPPRVEAREIRSAADPSLGYIALVIPQSDRAPHMVTVDGDNRHYRRNDKESVPCSQGDVERLYERRRRWEVDREAILDGAIADAPHPPVAGQSFLHAFAYPLTTDDGLLARIVRSGETERSALDRILKEAAEPAKFPASMYPRFREIQQLEVTRTGYRAWLSGNRNETDERKFRSYLTLGIDEDLSCRLFSGRASDLEGGKKLFFPDNAAGALLRFLWFTGTALAQAGYWGSVDVGVALTNLQGSFIDADNMGFIARHYAQREPYSRSDYRRTARFTVAQLQEQPAEAAKRLVMPLIREMSQEMYDPFAILTKQEPQP